MCGARRRCGGVSGPEVLTSGVRRADTQTTPGIAFDQYDKIPVKRSATPGAAENQVRHPTRLLVEVEAGGARSFAAGGSALFSVHATEPKRTGTVGFRSTCLHLPHSFLALRAEVSCLTRTVIPRSSRALTLFDVIEWRGASQVPSLRDFAELQVGYPNP